MIQRFGDIKRLVEQTLDPMVSAYFKNIGQTRTLIQLIQDRSAIQQLSGEQMKEKFAQYNLELQEVLIGPPTSGAVGSQIETILTQLRARQIAEEQVGGIPPGSIKHRLTELASRRGTAMRSRWYGIPHRNTSSWSRWGETTSMSSTLCITTRWTTRNASLR